MTAPEFATATEREALCGFLNLQRAALIRKVQGVSNADARKPPTASSLSLLGLLKHCALWERRWFQNIVAGRSFPGEFPQLEVPEDEMDAEDFRVDAHRRNGIDLRMRTEVEKIDLAAGWVLAHDLAAGRSFREGFDSLVIATGAVPVRPPLPGVDAVGVFGVQTLDDGAALLADLHRAQPRQAVVVGGGYIGVEMAEALVRRGVAVTVVDQAAQPMTTLDPDMGAAVHRAMEGIGIDVRTNTAVIGFETGSNHRIRSVLTADGSIPADVVVLGLGVRPNTSLAREAGLALGDHGGLRTNVQMQALGHDHIWAGGDCVEVLNLVSGQYQHVALGTHANKQGRVIGHNLAGFYATFPGVSARR